MEYSFAPLVDPNTVHGGKYSTDQMFVTYQVPDGDVSFKMREGTVYPDRVTLYSN